MIHSSSQRSEEAMTAEEFLALVIPFQQLNSEIQKAINLYKLAINRKEKKEIFSDNNERNLRLPRAIMSR